MDAIDLLFLLALLVVMGGAFPYSPLYSVWQGVFRHIWRKKTDRVDN